MTIEFVRDYRRPKHVAGMVVRLVGSRIVVTCRSDRGVRNVHEFALRDGVRVGSGDRAELVTADAPEPTSVEQRRNAARVDAAYREWVRDREDLERLRVLREAIDHCLDDRLTTVD